MVGVVKTLVGVTETRQTGSRERMRGVVFRGVALGGVGVTASHLRTGVFSVGVAWLSGRGQS